MYVCTRKYACTCTSVYVCVLAYVFLRICVCIFVLLDRPVSDVYGRNRSYNRVSGDVYGRNRLYNRVSERIGRASRGSGALTARSSSESLLSLPSARSCEAAYKTRAYNVLGFRRAYGVETNRTEVRLKVHSVREWPLLL
jgi:hypothetical protein